MHIRGARLVHPPEVPPRWWSTPERGAYLSATSTYNGGPDQSTQYGIYASNTYGPGLFTQVYANNMADAAFYIGACPDCNTVLDHAHGQNSAEGYSGTNSGGRLIIQNSEFDHNNTGFATNSQNNDDQPSPQSGHCPRNETGPTGTHSCWVLTHNSIHDNNNPNTPFGTSLAADSPIGTGVLIAGFPLPCSLSRCTIARTTSSVW